MSFATAHSLVSSTIYRMKIEVFRDSTDVLLIYDGTNEEVAEFRKLIKAFLDSKSSLIDVSELEFVESINGATLQFEDSEKTEGVKEISKNEFILYGTSNTWLDMLELSEAFEHDTIGRHQYLVDVGDIELILSNERGW